MKYLNESLGEVEKIKRFELIADEWTVQNGVLTPTLKVKRRVVMMRYENVIVKLFS